MIEKVTDAASMLWQALDTRERVWLMYGAAVIISLAIELSERRTKVQRQAQQDEAIAHRVAALVREGR